MRRWLLRAGRVLLGAVFVYAAYTKLRQPSMLFALSIDSYRLLPPWAVIVLARTLPWLEMLLGLLLIVGYQWRYAAAASSVLLVVFFGVMLRSHFKGLGIDCGCFGIGEALGPKTLLRDGLLVLLSLVLTWGGFRRSRNAQTSEAGKTQEGTS